jgi:hypothetical protein
VRIKSIVGIFAAVTFVGLLNFSIVETSWLSEQNLGAAKYPFVWEMTGVYTFLLLLPLLFLAATRFPIRRDNLATRIPLHAAIFVIFAVSHTLLMWGSRELIYRLLGWGHYDYGNMRYRFFMEGQKQLIVYVAIYSVLRFVAYARANRERDMTASRLERELTEARLAALKMQLQPHFLFNALNTIASHIEDDPRAAAAMVQHLSSFLRSTLRSSAAQEVPLRDEMDFLASYVAIMKARFEDRPRRTGRHARASPLSAADGRERDHALPARSRQTGGDPRSCVARRRLLAGHDRRQRPRPRRRSGSVRQRHRSVEHEGAIATPLRRAAAALVRESQRGRITAHDRNAVAHSRGDGGMTRVLIADDEAPARRLLRSCLARHDDVEVIGEAENGLEAVDAIR